MSAVVPCLPANQITLPTNSAANPAKPGDIVVARTANVLGFGPVGVVTLTRDIAGPPHYAEVVSWAASEVQFKVPNDLPSTGPWVLAFTPANLTKPCFNDGASLVPIYIDFLPHIIDVIFGSPDPDLNPELIVAEAPFTLLGVNFGASPRVKIEGVTMFGGNLHRGGQDSVGPTRVLAYMATVRALQSSPAYRANQLVMPVVLRVTNKALNVVSDDSAASQVKAYLPRPRPDVAGVTGNELYFGTIKGRADADHGGRKVAAQWLGAPRVSATSTGGEVRLYPADPTPRLAPLLPNFDDPPDILDAGKATQLRAVRLDASSKKLDVTEWHERGIIGTIPKDFTAAEGWAVVWRDDIPSLAQHFLRSIVADLPCTEAQLLPLVQRIVSFAPGAAPREEYWPGERVEVGLSLNLGDTANPLAQLLRSRAPGYSLELGFTLLDYAGKPVSPAPGSPVVMVTNGTLSTTGDFRPLDPPALTFQVRPGAGPTGDLWRLQVVARVRTPLCAPEGLPLLVLEQPFKQRPCTSTVIEDLVGHLVTIHSLPAEVGARDAVKGHVDISPDGLPSVGGGTSKLGRMLVEGLTAGYKLEVRVELLDKESRVVGGPADVRTSTDDEFANLKLPRLLKTPEFTFLPRPGVVEHRVEPGSGDLWTLRVVASVSVPLGCAQQVTLSRSFRKLPVRLPTMLAMFLEPNFARADDSAVLLVIPLSADLNEGDVKTEALTPLIEDLTELTASQNPLAFTSGPLFNLAKYMLPLAGAIVSQPNLVVVHESENANLNQITLVHNWLNDTEAEDTISSLALVGPPGTEVELFNKRDFDRSEGSFVLHTLEEMAVLVRLLNRKYPVSDPPTFDAQPPYRLLVVVEPNVRGKFDDEISSYKFTAFP